MNSLNISFNYKSTGFPFEDVDYKFETYRYYIQCFVEIINNNYSSIEQFINLVVDKSKHLQGFKGYDQGWVARFLKNAWNTEYILNFNLVDDPELARINNQWLPIQTYYAVYCAGEALAYLLDKNKANSHRTCLKKLNNFFVKLDISPWNLMYKGAIGKKSNEHVPINFLSNIQIPHNLARRDISPVQMVCKCLKVEHQKRVKDEFKKTTGKYKYSFDPSLTSLLNFLYRLRIISNYEEIDVFLTEAPDNVIMEFGKNLSFICLATLTLFEIIIIRKVGKTNFNSIVEDYLRMNNNASALQNRNEHYLTLIR